MLVAADGAQRQPVLAAVGELQFDVVVARLTTEYGVQTSVERLPFRTARVIVTEPAALSTMYWPYAGALRLRDHDGRLIVLFHSKRTPPTTSRRIQGSSSSGSASEVARSRPCPERSALRAARGPEQPDPARAEQENRGGLRHVRGRRGDADGQKIHGPSVAAVSALVDGNGEDV